jgi:hypothetical protein
MRFALPGETKSQATHWHNLSFEQKARSRRRSETNLGGKTANPPIGIGNSEENFGLKSVLPIEIWRIEEFVLVVTISINRLLLNKCVSQTKRSRHFLIKEKDFAKYLPIENASSIVHGEDQIGDREERIKD